MGWIQRAAARLVSRRGDLARVPGPPSVPGLGTGYLYLPVVGRYKLLRLHEANLAKQALYGPVVKEEFQWGKPVIHLYDPEDFRAVLRQQGKYPMRLVNEFVRKYRLERPLLYESAGVAHETGPEWHRLRSVVAPLLLQHGGAKSPHIQSQLKIAEDCVELLRNLRDPCDQVVEDIREVFYRLALESICHLCLGTRLGCLQRQPPRDAVVMIEALKEMFVAYQKLYYGLPLWKYMQTPAYRMLGHSESTLYETIMRYIDEALTDGPERNSLLTSLVRQNRLSQKEISTTIVDFIAGGVFTVTHTLVFLLHHLAHSPRAQARLLQEASATSGEFRLDMLPYNRACLKETFRLTPTVPCIVRILPDDIALPSGYQIPAGVPLFLHFTAPCRDPQRFESPEEFRPERWLTSSATTHQFCLLPFGYGSRMCSGRSYAELEIAITISKLIQELEPLPFDNEPMDLVQKFIVVPAHSIHLRFPDRAACK
ncbi:hypothetical protein LAZ67_1000125 [Cordylochernes scorpioides]|uniref:Uncharacterized protein n=1 Tax=Cordylochernes scorpioides TaxID=51811 RepID=A0ABY6JVW5_9ARAC|nr:hypothetical protein LAZ67_1000125 [Cordylochernes scorpioides]